MILMRLTATECTRASTRRFSDLRSRPCWYLEKGGEFSELRFFNRAIAIRMLHGAIPEEKIGTGCH
jgi:hypothetical protein